MIKVVLQIIEEKHLFNTWYQYKFNIHKNVFSKYKNTKCEKRKPRSQTQTIHTIRLQSSKMHIFVEP